MKKTRLLIVFAGLLVIVALFFGCGQTTTSDKGKGGGTTPNYTISGKVGNVTASGVRSSAVLSVTHIIAIGANNEKFMTTPDASGNFSLPVVSGCPYALGFYNQTNSAITLLGYLRQKNFDWHSLPLMNPTGEATNLGTVEVNATSIEAVPSIGLNDLLTQTSMDQAAANLYGQVDGVMSIFTNVDVDGNGVFDFQESKAYLLSIGIGTNIGSSQGIASGEVNKMLNQYNESYNPVPNAYQIIFHAIDYPIPSDGTPGTIKFPTTIYGNTGLPRTYLNAEVWGASSGQIWGFMANQNTESLAQCELITPEVVPSGSYTFEVTGKGTYTFKNIIGSPMAAVGITEGIIFPVFKMVTNGAGYVTTIYYKWMIREGIVTREATATEIKAVIVDQDLITLNCIEPSPTLGITTGSYPSTDPGSFHGKKISRDSNSVDVTAWNVKFSEIAMFQCNYALNSNISLGFMFGK